MPRLRGDTGLSLRHGISGYRAILSIPGAAGFFGAAAIARQGAAMTRLAVLWAVHGATGSFAAAGVATALFAIAQSVARPQVSRLVDAYGQSRVLPWTVIAFAIAIIALSATTGLHSGPYILIGAATMAGATSPQVAAFSAARWRYVLHDDMTTALSLEGALNDVTFLCGPSLVSTLSAVLFPAAGLIAAGILVVVGMTAFLAQRRTEPPPSRRWTGQSTDRRMWTPPVVTLFLVNLFMGFFFGAAPVVLTAFAFAAHAAALAGPIGVVGSIVSLSAGVLYGAIGRHVRPARIMFTVSILLVVGCALLSAIPNLPTMFVCYGAVGGVAALILVPAAVLLQQTTPASSYTRANTWMSSASAAGIAISAPLAGIATQWGGWRLGWIIAAGLTAALPITIAVAISRSILVPKAKHT